MSKKDLPLIIAGVGVLYLVTRSSSSPAYSGSGTTVPGGGVSIPGVGSLVSSISNLIGSFFHGGVTVSNPGTDVVNNPGGYPNFVGTPGPPDSGDPCDVRSVQFNADVCTEMGGQPYTIEY